MHIISYKPLERLASYKQVLRRVGIACSDSLTIHLVGYEHFAQSSIKFETSCRYFIVLD